MADTGAPWNIPYVENADLVKDYPTASLALANAIANGLDAALIPGIGSNVVQTVKTDVYTSTATSYTDITGLTVTITPTSATSKVLLIAQVSATVSGTAGHAFALQLAGGNTSGYVGDAASNRRQSVLGGPADGSSGRVLQGFGAYQWPIVYLDSPATTSATTYSVQSVVLTGSTFYLNQSSTDTDALGYSRTVSSLTAIEVSV